MDHGFGFVPFSDLRVIFYEFHQKYTEVYNFQFSCKNQKEYKGYLRCFPAADGHCEVNDQTGGRGQLSMRAVVFPTSALYPP